jgi:DNA polymerase III gamma/tau subunit
LTRKIKQEEKIIELTEEIIEGMIEGMIEGGTQEKEETREIEEIIEEMIIIIEKDLILQGQTQKEKDTTTTKRERSTKNDPDQETTNKRATIKKIKKRGVHQKVIVQAVLEVVKVDDVVPKTEYN